MVFRFIAHNDDNNPYLESLEKFAEEIKVFRPALIAVGGLQMMDNFPFLEGSLHDLLFYSYHSLL